MIPTLRRVAKNLKWTGHELSQRIDDLEKLDETCLMAVGHMYAQKRCMKAYHDEHIISKNMKKGHLVLTYTLKQHLGKLKKRGYGPCIVEEISPSYETNHIRWRENVNLPESENVSKETETDDPNDAWDYKELERKRGISEPPDANQSNHSWREFTPFSGERRTLLLKEDDCRSLCTEPTGYCTRARCRQGFYCLCKKFADAQA